MNNVALKILVLVIIIALGGVAAFAIHQYTDLFKTEPELPPVYEITEQPKPKETTLFFGGDIMLSRNVGTAIVKANDPTLPFKKMVDIIKNADISFANLESPFNNKGPRKTEGLVFKAEPNTVEGLTYAGFDVLSTANNHGFDQGEAGLLYTLDWLTEHGIKPVGTGGNCHKGVVIEANGLRVGYLAYSYSAYNDGGKVPSLLVCDWRNQAQVTTDIANIGAQVDFLIVSAHMGTEYQRKPDEFDAEGARNAIGTGADLVIGHHPHWVQTIEEYHGKYIFHSLGNFVFDQMWSQDTREGLGVKLLFKDKKLDRIELLPVVIDDYCCPRQADETETENILSKINPNYSSPVMVENGKTTPSWMSAIQNKKSENSSAPIF
jgi:gamma-polyglutamate biosynthesis protein CapA